MARTATDLRYDPTLLIVALPPNKETDRDSEPRVLLEPTPPQRLCNYCFGCKGINIDGLGYCLGLLPGSPWVGHEAKPCALNLLLRAGDQCVRFVCVQCRA